MRVSDFIPRFVKLSDLESRIVEVEWLHIHFYFVAVEKHIQKLKIESTNYQSLMIWFSKNLEQFYVNEWAIIQAFSAIFEIVITKYY